MLFYLTEKQIFWMYPMVLPGKAFRTRLEGYPFSEAIYGAQEIKKCLPDMLVFGVDGITDAESAEQALHCSCAVRVMSAVKK